jgi:hypothetical protein
MQAGNASILRQQVKRGGLNGLRGAKIGFMTMVYGQQ